MWARVIISFCLLLPLSNTANSAMFKLTMFSRANCAGFNESVSWDASHEWSLFVISDQAASNGSYRTFESNAGYQNRAYAGCAACTGNTEWTVEGTHNASFTDRDEFDYLDNYCEFTPMGGGPYSAFCRYTTGSTCNLSEW